MKNRAKSREGFSLVEIMVAMTIMLGAVMSLAAGTAAVARMSNGSADRVHRAAAVEDYANTLSTMPWRELPTASSCEDVDGPHPYERCVTVTVVSPRERQLEVIVTPDSPRIDPDTIVVDRGRYLSPNPLAVP